MTSACFSRNHTGFSRNATLVARVNPPALAGGVFNSGYTKCNPILMASGATDIACGAITACEYYAQPFFCGVPLVDILQSSTIGNSVSLLLTGIELIINRKKYTPTEKIKTLSSRIAMSGLLSGLSVISAPIAITAAAGFAGFKLAKASAKRDEAYLKAMPLTGNFSKNIDRMILSKYPNLHSLRKPPLSFEKKYLESKNE